MANQLGGKNEGIEKRVTETDTERGVRPSVKWQLHD